MGQAEQIGVEGRLYRRAARVEKREHRVGRQHHHCPANANHALPAARPRYTAYSTGLRPSLSLTAGSSIRPAALAADPSTMLYGAADSGKPRSAAILKISGLNSSTAGADSATAAAHSLYCGVRSICL